MRWYLYKYTCFVGVDGRGGGSLASSGDFTQKEPPKGAALWKARLVLAGRGMDSRVSGTSLAVREANARYLWESVLCRTVFCLKETNRFKGDQEWGSFLERLQVGACTEADCEYVNTRKMDKLSPAEQARFGFAPLLSSFNTDVAAYNTSTSMGLFQESGEPGYEWEQPDYVMNAGGGRGKKKKGGRHRDNSATSSSHRPLLYALLGTQAAFGPAHVSSTGSRYKRCMYFNSIRGVISENDQKAKGRAAFSSVVCIWRGRGCPVDPSMRGFIFMCVTGPLQVWGLLTARATSACIWN